MHQCLHVKVPVSRSPRQLGWLSLPLACLATSAGTRAGVRRKRERAGGGDRVTAGMGRGTTRPVLVGLLLLWLLPYFFFERERNSVCCWAGSEIISLRLLLYTNNYSGKPIPYSNSVSAQPIIRRRCADVISD